MYGYEDLDPKELIYTVFSKYISNYSKNVPDLHCQA